MTRMFLRFYLGVLMILVLAWAILAYVYRARSVAKNIRVVELALGGGAKLARESLIAASPEASEATLTSIQQAFDYPVRIVAWAERPMSAEQNEQLSRGDAVLRFSMIEVALPDNQHLLEFGPLPEFAGPVQAEVMLGIGGILSLTAIAIAFLLRPVATQLRAVERTATAISAGDLSARIDTTEAPKGIAFALAFNKMADRVQTLLRTQRELLQAVSHELRTPLAKIRFAADLIESSKTEEERRTRIDAVDKATQNLDDLVGELLRYVRLESVVSETELTRTDVRELILELLDTHAPLHPSIQFQMMSHEIELSWLGDRNSLSIALGNLISNAAKFANTHIQVAAHRETEFVSIEVDDDGPGIAEENRERVFEPFVRLDESSGRGVGLGLALVNRIATRCGGSVTTGTSPLGGAKFTLTLPLSPSEAGC